VYSSKSSGGLTIYRELYTYLPNTKRPVPKKQEKEEHGQELEERIEDLTRELSGLINASGTEGRDELRDYAISLLQGATETSTIEEQPLPATNVSSSFNPFALAIPFFLTGAFLLLLFPPIGLFLILGAVIMMVWGGLVALLFRKR
jgi:hypothetical protein